MQLDADLLASKEAAYHAWIDSESTYRDAQARKEQASAAAEVI